MILKKLTCVSLGFAASAGLLFAFGCLEQQRVRSSTKPSTTTIEFQSVAKYFQPDGSVYLTEQRHTIYPSEVKLRITACEPQGKLLCDVSRDRFSFKADTRPPLFSLCCNENITRGLLELYIASLRPGAAEGETLSSDSELIRFQGRAYRKLASDGEAITLFRNEDTGQVDMVRVTESANGNSYVILGYNYIKLKAGGALPGKVDIFRLSQEGQGQILTGQHINHIVEP